MYIYITFEKKKQDQSQIFDEINIISDINNDRVEWFFVLLVILKLNIHVID